MEDAKIDHGEGKDAKPEEKQATMNKKECIAVQKVLQDLSLDQIKELKTLPATEIQNEI